MVRKKALPPNHPSPMTTPKTPLSDNRKKRPAEREREGGSSKASRCGGGEGVFFRFLTPSTRAISVANQQSHVGIDKWFNEPFSYSVDLHPSVSPSGMAPLPTGIRSRWDNSFPFLKAQWRCSILSHAIFCHNSFQPPTHRTWMVSTMSQRRTLN